MKKLISRIASLTLCLMLLCAGAFAAPADWMNPIAGTEMKKAEAKDDFNAYVNHDWMQSVELPAGYSKMTVFSELDFITRAQVMELLKNGEATSHDAQLAQNFFRLMVDMDGRNAVGTAPLQEVIRTIEAIDSIDALTGYLLEHATTDSLLLNFGLQPDFADSTLYVAAVTNDSFLLGDAAEYRERTAYGERLNEANAFLMGEMYAHMGRTKEEGERVYRSALALESRAASHAYAAQEAYSADYFQKIYNLYTLEQLDTLNSAFPLRGLIEAAGFDAAPHYIVVNPAYHAVCDELYTQENLEGLKALLICNSVHSRISILDQKSLDILNEASAMVSGAQGTLSLEETAYDNVSALLPGPVGRMYVEAHFSQETRQDVEAMIDQIIAVYRSRLEKADWLTQETRAKAVAKLDSMTVRVGYGEKWADYSGLKIDAESSFYDAYMAYVHFAVNRASGRVGERVDRDEWDSASHSVNAFYNPQDNSINILAGILMPPFYTPGGSIEANLGGIGTVIGHEITHAFDITGSQFDADGNMNSWWTEQDYAAFLERSAAIAQYFGAVEVQSGLFVNGVMTQGEAVADLGGVSAALEIASGIEGFDYETFFETYARIWRHKSTQEEMESAVHTDPHPLGYLRCNITVQQFEEFYETYGVEEGDGMYLAPEARLSVW